MGDYSREDGMQAVIPKAKRGVNEKRSRWAFLVSYVVKHPKRRLPDNCGDQPLLWVAVRMADKSGLSKLRCESIVFIAFAVLPR